MTNHNHFLTSTYKIVLLLISLLALISPAIYNGFPLVYSDSGTYIAAAKTDSIPVDRPLVYSLFLNFTSLNLSLWFTIIFQCAVLIYLIYLLFSNVLKIKHSYEWTAGVILILSFTTSVSNYSSQLMPDIFVAWMLLSFFLILWGRDLKLIIKVLLWIVFLLSVTSHLSILLSASVIIVLTLLINILFKILNKKINHILIGLLITGWLTIPIINLFYGAGFTVSRCKNVTLMARLVETGIVGEFLKENCQKEKYSLCDSKDSLPQYGYQFAWDQTSPLYKGPCWDTGWGNCWLEKDEEYGKLIRDIIKTPKFRNELIIISIKDTYKQLLDFKIGMLVPMRETSPPYGTIKTFYPQNLESYIKANQFRETLYFSNISNIQKIFVIISILILPFILVWYFWKQRRCDEFCFLMILVVFGLIINACVCSSFSTVVDRYQSRIIWIVPFLFITSFAVLINRNKGQLR